MTNELFDNLDELNPTLAKIENDKANQVQAKVESDATGITIKKFKKSQATNLVNNSMSFVDNNTKITYSVSVSVSVQRKDSVGELAPQQLAALQAIITEFVKELPSFIE